MLANWLINISQLILTCLGLFFCFRIYSKMPHGLDELQIYVNQSEERKNQPSDQLSSENKIPFQDLAISSQVMEEVINHFTS